MRVDPGPTSFFPPSLEVQDGEPNLCGKDRPEYLSPGDGRKEKGLNRSYSVPDMLTHTCAHMHTYAHTRRCRGMPRCLTHIWQGNCGLVELGAQHLFVHLDVPRGQPLSDTPPYEQVGRGILPPRQEGCFNLNLSGKKSESLFLSFLFFRIIG